MLGVEWELVDRGVVVDQSPVEPLHDLLPEEPVRGEGDGAVGHRKCIGADRTGAPHEEDVSEDRVRLHRGGEKTSAVGTAP
eukprot:9455656-Lingulodinium_polyedra.AAC.1